MRFAHSRLSHSRRHHSWRGGSRPASLQKSRSDRPWDFSPMDQPFLITVRFDV